MYYVMACDSLFPRTTIGVPPSLPRGPWMTGELITYEVPEPLVYELDPDYPGQMLPFYRSAAPLMREDLLAALDSAGVDNLQLFRAILRDPKKRKDYEDYRAVNIVGLVQAADLGRSVMMGTSPDTLIAADFDSLVFDESKPRGLLMFRLAESVSAIVVHETVKQAIEAAGVPGMTFYESGEWSG